MKKRIKIQSYFGVFESAEDSVSEVIRDFKDTGLYSKYFLKDLEAGLRKFGFA